MTSRERKRYWIIERNKQARYVNSYRVKFYNALKNDVNHLLNKVESNGINSINSFIFSEQISKTIYNLYAEIGAREARRSYNLSRKEFIDWIMELFSYIGDNFYNKGTLKIVDKTKRMIIAYIEQTLVGEKTMAEAVREIRADKTFDKELKIRAATIARTEVGKAVHSGRMVGADKSPFVQEKIWISVKDSRSRGNPFKGQNHKTDHYHMDGQVVELNEMFYDSRSGHLLAHPHDPKGEAGDVINCRCTYGTRSKRDENGNFIRKQRLTSNQFVQI